jgi:hypothetical protein
MPKPVVSLALDITLTTMRGIRPPGMKGGGRAIKAATTATTTTSRSITARRGSANSSGRRAAVDFGRTRRTAAAGASSSSCLGDNADDDKDDDDDEALAVERKTNAKDVSRGATRGAISGCEYEVIRVRGRSSGSSGPRFSDATVARSKVMKVFVIPGNPGVPAYYEHFAMRLCEKLTARTGAEKDVEVEIVGYLGHTVKERFGRNEWFTLQEQKEHVRAHVRESLAADGGNAVVEAVIVGHSIGAHLALDAMKALGSDSIRSVVGLMPFLHVNTQSPTQKMLGFVTRLSLLVHAIGKTLDFIGIELKRKLLANTVSKEMDARAAVITSSWLRWQSLINMVFMGRTEFEHLLTPIDDCDLVRNACEKKSLSLVYCQGDHWAPLHQRDVAAKMNVPVQSIEDVSVRHDFVVKDDSSASVADITAALLSG